MIRHTTADRSSRDNKYLANAPLNKDNINTFVERSVLLRQVVPKYCFIQ